MQRTVNHAASLGQGRSHATHHELVSLLLKTDLLTPNTFFFFPFFFRLEAPFFFFGRWRKAFPRAQQAATLTGDFLLFIEPAVVVHFFRQKTYVLRFKLPTRIL
jgi:hypothetical protein